MNIQGFSGITHAYSQHVSPRPNQATAVAEQENHLRSSATQVSISEQAKALAFSDSTVAERLESIKAKPATQRSKEEFEFVQKHDTKLAEIVAKDPNSQTAEEINYMQQASGFVNTMANLSPQERKLYDELVANGDTEAVRAMGLIAMSRMADGDVALANGVTFDPSKTEITSSNVKRLFSQLFANEDGADSRSFDALAKYLDSRQSPSLA